MNDKEVVMIDDATEGDLIIAIMELRKQLVAVQMSADNMSFLVARREEEIRRLKAENAYLKGQK